MEKITNLIKNHLDFRIYPVTIIAIISALLIIPMYYLLPERYAWENGLLENTQMVALFAGIYLSLTTKNNKGFFQFAALVLIILILREINCGRTIFFPIPGTENQFYRWKDIKYGWLAHPLYGLYMAFVGGVFFVKKLYIDLFNMIKNIKFPIWNILLILLGMGLGLWSEKALDNMVLEEGAELLFYISLIGIIYIYSRRKPSDN